MNLAYDTAARRALSAPVLDRGFAQALNRSLRAVWTALESVGRARARRQLLQLAQDIQASRPELAMQLRQTARRGWL